MWTYHRKIRTHQERVANQGRQPYEEIEGYRVKMRRPGRNHHSLDPWAWEPIGIIDYRCWKRYRKTQYKPK